MDLLNNISNKLFLTIGVFIDQFRSLNDHMVKSDDENLEKLLKNPEDRVKFQRAIDEVTTKTPSKEINLNGKNITISI